MSRKKLTKRLGTERLATGFINKNTRSLDTVWWKKAYKTIPKIHRILNDGKKARDSWIRSKSGRFALKASGFAVGAATAVLTLFTAPLTPVALATAGLSLASGTAIPGVEWLLDWRNGNHSIQENCLHYLLKFKKK